MYFKQTIYIFVVHNKTPEMKKILLTFVATFVAFVAAAQAEHSIILDQNSFRAVQSDALTGVNIDKIADDTSRKPCARVKIKFANMSRAEVDALDVKFQSNTDLAKRKVAEYYDNVLILEMTAKPNTRFYVKSPDFGESNEVTLNLEAYKEYELEARLNQTFSIVVDSNVEGADVYIDNHFKGRTDANFKLTIKDVMIGDHTLKIVYGGISAEQKIVVNSGNISFRQSVNTTASKPQYVVFTVEPKNSVITIDGQIYVAEDGVVIALLENGNHTFKAEARGYHPQSETFTVSGAKIERSITLKGDYTNVTIKADNGADIYINDKKVGTTTWSGSLNSGLYLFEARKLGYHTQSLTQQITSDNPQQSYTLPALTPIYGSADINSSPAMADIYIDGKSVGRTPLQLDNLLVGSHTVKLSKSGYADNTQTITVAEGKTTTVNATLTKPQDSPTPKPTQKPTKTPTYKEKKVVKPHYEQSIEMNYLFHAVTGSMVQHVGLNYIGGYRANRVLFIGAGVGVAYNFDNIDNTAAKLGEALSTGGVNLPMFIHARAYMGARSRTFAALSVGGTLIGSDKYTHSTGEYKYHTNGIFADASLGLSLNRFYLSAGLTMQSLPTIGSYSDEQMYIKSEIGVGAKISMGFTF